MRVLIIGAGEVGSYLARFLASAHHQVTVIDCDAEKGLQLEEQVEVAVQVGSGANLDVLRSAGALETDLLLAMTSSDEVNVLSAQLGKHLGVKRAIVRIKSAELLAATQSYLREEMGIDLIVNLPMRAAAQITSLISPGKAAGITDFGFGHIHCRTFEVLPDSQYSKRPIKDLHLSGAVIVAAVRDGDVVVPSGGYQLAAGDRFFAVTKRDAVPLLQKGVGETAEHVKQIFIVGGGRIGAAVARHFDNPRYRVKLFEINKAHAYLLKEKLKHVTVIERDGLDLGALEEEYIESADAFVAATGVDEKNLIAAVLAKEHGVPRTIAIVDKLQYARMGEKLGLTGTLAPRLLAAEQILAFIQGGQVHRIALIEEGQAEVVEFHVGRTSSLIDRSLAELDLPTGVIIGAIVQGAKALIPTGKSIIRAGDAVIMCVLKERMPFVESLLRESSPGGR
jgi:trk system potassium uptake protein TrkA